MFYQIIFKSISFSSSCRLPAHKCIPVLEKTCPKCLTRKVFLNHRNLTCLGQSSLQFTTSSRYCQKSVELSYTSFEGTSSLPPLLILHGLLGSKLNWKSLAKRICQQTQRKVITVDARNHGDSPHDDNMEYETMAADVEDFILKHLKPSKVVLVGHSLGGKTAMLTALRKPDLVDSLVVVDMTPTPVIVDDPAKAPIAQLLAAMKLAVDELPSKGLTLTEARRLCDIHIEKIFPELALRQFVLTNLVQSDTGKIFWKVNLKAIMKNFPSLLSQTLPKLQFHKPTIFICGANSGYVKDRDSDKEEIYAYFPKAEIIHIQDAGHWVHSEKPEEFLSHLLRFLKNNEGLH